MVFAGDYELLERLGEGGTRARWRARSAGGREVLITRFADVDAARFDEAARVAEALEHPSLSPLLDHGEDDRGGWIASPITQGMTLRDAVGERRLSPESALVLVHPVVDALCALHAAGLVHGDVAPENVIVSPLGDVTLIGAGLGFAEGALPYRSPERIEGRDVDASADVWALGVVIYELVAGRRPFASDGASEEDARFVPLAELDRRVSPELDWLVSVCLARDPWSRPRDARAVMDRLRPLVPSAIDRLRTERVALVSDPTAYERALGERMARALVEDAQAALARADTFAALRAIDRALAHRPAHEAARSLAERVSAGDLPRVTREPRPPTERPTKEESPRASVVVLAALGLAIAVAAALFIALAREPTPIAVASRIAPEAADAGLPALEPLRLELLPDELPPATEGLAAAEGEPLVLPEMIHGRAPMDLLMDAQRALTADPEDIGARVDRAAALLALDRRHEGLTELAALARDADPRAQALAGLVALREGRFDEADARLSSAIERDAQAVDARLWRGILRDRMGRVRDAYEDLALVIEARPLDVTALAELARIYARAGQSREAVPILRRILARRPESADAWIDLAIALGPSDEGVAAIDRALAIAPDDPRALRERCILLGETRGAGALAACERAITIAPGDAELYMTRATVRSRDRQHAAALADADRALELAPDAPSLLYARYRVRERAGDAGGAFRDLSAACAAGHDAACSELAASGVMPAP